MGRGSPTNYIVVLFGRSSCHAGLGRVVMNKFIGALIILLAGGLLIGCGGENNPAPEVVSEARVGIMTACDSLTSPAVSLSVVDSTNSLAINSAEIRYRANDGNWTTLEKSAAQPYVISGAPGKYDLEVRAAQYILQTAVVFVPQDESCEILQQDVRIGLTRPIVCPNPPSVIILNVIEPDIQAGLGINVNIPLNNGVERQCTNGECIVNLQTGSIGEYTVQFIGFPDQRELNIVNNIVHYSYSNTIIQMSVDNRTHQLITEGVENVGLKIPFEYGDSGCLEVIFDRVVATRLHHLAEDSNMVETREMRPFQIADSSSPICARNRVDISVDYEVILPAGTALADVNVDYLNNANWVPALCGPRYDNNTGQKKYICTARYMNPLFGDSYNIRTTIDGQEFFGSYISLENRCIFFE
jgi:hypothetical protein